MKTSFYLVVNERGMVRVSNTKKPEVAPNEVSIGMSLEIPTALFQKPQLSATITIPEGAVQAPEISAETLSSVQEALEVGLGMQVKIGFVEGT